MSRNQEVLLIDPVDGLGNEGDQVSVKAGYARNYLLRLKKAVPINRANKKQIESLRTRKMARLAKEREVAEEIAQKLASVNIAIAMKTGPGGKLFGSVTAQRLSERLSEEGLCIDRRQIHLDSPVKELGRHEIQIKLHPELTVDFGFDVVSENPIEEDGEADQAEEEAETTEES